MEKRGKYKCYPKSLAQKLVDGSVPDGECRLWCQLIDKQGYGRLWHNGKLGSVHRMSYETFVGPIPDDPTGSHHGIEVCHHCDVRHCIEPMHLFLGTHQDNMTDGVRKGRFPGRRKK